MMRDYQIAALATRTFHVGEVRDLPRGIILRFAKCELRLLRSDLGPAYFACSIAIPSMEDDQGFILELRVDEWQKDYEDVHDDGPLWRKEYDPEEDRMVTTSPYNPEINFRENPAALYSAPWNENAPDKLVNNALLSWFEEGPEIFLSVSVPGTSYAGCAYIPKELYRRNG